MTYDVEVRDASTHGDHRLVHELTMDVAPPREHDMIEIDDVGYFVRSVAWVFAKGTLSHVVLTV